MGRGEERSRKRKMNRQEDGGESAGAPNLACQPIIRGVLSCLDRSVSSEKVAQLSPEVTRDATVVSFFLSPNFQLEKVTKYFKP